MDIISNIFDRIGFPILLVLFLALFALESRYGLRRRVQPRIRRILTNTAVALPAFALLRFAFIPAVVWIAVHNEAQWQFGLNYLYQLPGPVEFLVGFLLLDYSLYIWHILLHRVPLLWRFHTVHHTDLDLDLTTAVRFHFVEMIGSVVFRGACVWLIGASPLLVIVYEIVFEAATNFHHSNWKIPLRVEQVLNKLVVTPRMHGIHHSIVRKETDSNYATIFSCWDRLHRTLRLHIAQDDVVIGVPAYRDPSELTAWRLLKMPFQQSRKWQLPDGTVPMREERPEPGQVRH